jgi:cell division protein FtsB
MEILAQYTLKQWILRLLVCVECLFFVGIYCMGSHGWYARRCLQREINTLTRQVHELEVDNSNLDDARTRWHNSSFGREKMARERLQMARAGETVYYIKPE